MFAPGRLFWKLFLGNVALLAVVLSTCLWLIGREVSRLQDRELSLRLLNQAHAYRELVQDRFDAAHGRELDALVKRISRDLTVPTRITLIRSDGTVLADSQADPHEMEPHDRRPEVTTALRGGLGEDTRLSQTLGRPMRYLAIAVSSGGPPAQGPVGVVRVAMPVVTISAEAGSMQRLIWGIGLLILAASFALALGLALLWTRPIRRITVAAQSLSQGDLNTRIHVGGGDELAALARALNEMRGRLADHLETIDLQRRTLEALLAQLHEGVVVAGPNGRVVLMNPAAARMLDLPFTINALTGESERSVEETIPQHELQQLLLPGRARAGGADGPEQAREIRWRSSETGAELSLLASASDIALPVRPPGVQAAETTRPGRLLVLADVTPLTRMLQMKADFAANASHELRTPLSAIRAAIETLGRVDLASEADTARHFIDVIDRHGKRLEMLVADLLELSRLESARAQFRPSEVRLGELLAEVREQHDEALARKMLRWETDLPPGLDRIWANSHLIRVILDNLVDNAIKFSDPGGRVRVRCRQTAGPAGATVSLAVEDEGCGIRPEEQARVFERFYQVERARSGSAMRGTGLGLSIVRHAVAAMKGTVELTSEPGRGTTVTVQVPQSPDSAAVS